MKTSTPLRRRAPVALLAALVIALLLVAAPGTAHHGGDGEYDASAPLWIEGEVTTARYGYPHATLELDLNPGTRAPEDLPNGAEDLRGAEHWSGLTTATVDRVSLTLPPDLTAEVGASDERPESGDRVSAIAYAECESGELRVQLIEFADTVDTYGGSITNIVNGCDDTAAAAPSTATRPTADGETATDQSSDDGFVFAFGIATAAVVIVLAGFVVARGRRLGRVSNRDGT